jgi:hypothetical protein
MTERTVTTTQTLRLDDVNSHVWAYQARLAVERGWHFWMARYWQSGVPIQFPKTPLTSATMGARRPWSAAWTESGVLVAAQVNTIINSINLRLVAPTAAKAEEVFAFFERTYPLIVSTEYTVPWEFWMIAKNGSRSSTRPIEAITWKEVIGNYTADTAAALAQLMTMKQAPDMTSGRLILWHGAPGTGKSHAIRALATEWRPWCTFCYITDPVQFFGGGAEYLFDVLEDDDEIDPVSDDVIPVRSRRWKCLVLEDTGELMAMDAKQQTGQGLGRLLNLSDGVLGQGSNVLILITTNEDMDKFHPAVTRKGRCRANVGFSLLSAEEAQAWAVAHKIDIPKGGAVLADLYASLGNQIITPRATTAGFRTR